MGEGKEQASKQILHWFAKAPSLRWNQRARDRNAMVTPESSFHLVHLLPAAFLSDWSKSLSTLCDCAN